MNLCGKGQGLYRWLSKKAYTRIQPTPRQKYLSKVLGQIVREGDGGVILPVDESRAHFHDLQQDTQGQGRSVYETNAIDTDPSDWRLVNSWIREKGKNVMQRNLNGVNGYGRVLYDKNIPYIITNQGSPNRESFAVIKNPYLVRQYLKSHLNENQFARIDPYPRALGRERLARDANNNNMKTVTITDTAPNSTRGSVSIPISALYAYYKAGPRAAGAWNALINSIPDEKGRQVLNTYFNDNLLKYIEQWQDAARLLKQYNEQQRTSAPTQASTQRVWSPGAYGSSLLRQFDRRRPVYSRYV